MENTDVYVTHWNRDKMATILQTNIFKSIFFQLQYLSSKLTDVSS